MESRSAESEKLISQMEENSAAAKSLQQRLEAAIDEKNKKIVQVRELFSFSLS